jgi:hypothetical protein
MVMHFIFFYKSQFISKVELALIILITNTPYSQYIGIMYSKALTCMRKVRQYKQMIPLLFFNNELTILIAFIKTCSSHPAPALESSTVSKTNQGEI